ncbi:MAG: hypothetical protein PHI24_13075, partial [Desulfitobacteriaceae bacterium]|nr:hypothetical protein [Desulfitobacteriaceae bacterium]
MILPGIRGSTFLFYQLEILPAILCEKFAALAGSLSLLKTLMPRQRSDAGTPRSLDNRTIDQIYQLREKFPRINATLIYNKLIED